ncbi:pyridoxamine 5'-phosphate oxidase family protein [Halobiforma nitratireducens]|uniref:pyridoxamine 5'-phosphate oxidase family protein n=1 Tax=Halobiforma nitratireducens TaxID=130048 RepID=UPI000677B709|nr:pyridoxamine 5'-phosphate oxidase family protein [Halobiforma nitratireducens]
MTIPTEAQRRLTDEPLVAHLGTCSDGRPHVAPVWYRYDGDDVLEIVTTGRKLENLRENPRVALSIQSDEGGDPDWTITLLGTATVVDDEEQSVTARHRIHERYGADPDAYDENVLVRIKIGTANYQTY